MDLKQYVIKTKISKNEIINLFEDFFQICQNIENFPAPVYEILGNENNKDLLALLIKELNLQIKLGELLKEELNVKKIKMDSSTFLKTVDQNSKLFNFEIPEEKASYQIYIGKNLKNLLKLKFSLIYYIYQSDAHNRINKIIGMNINEENIDDFEEVKEEILSSGFDCLEEVFVSKYFIERDFEMKELIVEMKSESEKIDKFKLTIIKAKDPKILEGIDEESNEKDLYLKLIKNQINPRIKIMSESLVNSIMDNIDFLNKIVETEINIRESDNSKYYAFFNEINRYIMSGIWFFKDLIQKNKIEEITSKKDDLEKFEEEKSKTISDSVDTPDYNNDGIIKEANSIDDPNLISDNFEPINNLYTWIIDEEKRISEMKITNYKDYLKFKISEIYKEKLKDSLKDWLFINLKEVISDHLYINEILKSFQINLLDKEFKIVEEIKKKYEVDEIELIINTYKIELKRIDGILCDDHFNDWLKDGLIDKFFIEPWISFINSKLFLNRKSTFKIEDKIPFLKEMKDCDRSEEVVNKPNIAQDYLKKLYNEKYMKSKKINKYKIIFEDLRNMADLMYDFKEKIYERINLLFQKTEDLLPEERGVVELIVNQKQPPSNLKYNKAIEHLTKKGIIKKIQILTLGND